MVRRGRPVVGHCEECGMMVNSRYNDFDVDDIISGLYYGPEGEYLCRYHKDSLNNDDEDCELDDPDFPASRGEASGNSL